MPYYYGKYFCGERSEEDLLEMVTFEETFNPWYTVFDFGPWGIFSRITDCYEDRLRYMRHRWERDNITQVYGEFYRKCRVCRCNVKQWRPHVQTKKHRDNTMLVVDTGVCKLLPTDLKYLLLSFILDTKRPSYYPLSVSIKCGEEYGRLKK